MMRNNVLRSEPHVEETLWVLKGRKWKEKRVILKPVEVGGKSLGCSLEIKSLRKVKKRGRSFDLGPEEQFILYLDSYHQKNGVLAILPIAHTQWKLFVHASDSVLKGWYERLSNILRVSSFVVSIPEDQSIRSGSAVIHVFPTKFYLVSDVPPKFSVLGQWPVDDFMCRCQPVQGGVQLNLSGFNKENKILLQCNQTLELIGCLRSHYLEILKRRQRTRSSSTSSLTLNSTRHSALFSEQETKSRSVSDLNGCSSPSPPVPPPRKDVSPTDKTIPPLFLREPAKSNPPVPDRLPKTRSWSSSSSSSCSSLEKPFLRISPTFPPKLAGNPSTVTGRRLPSPMEFGEKQGSPQTSPRNLSSVSSTTSSIIDDENTHSFVHYEKDGTFHMHSCVQDCESNGYHGLHEEQLRWYINLPERPRRYIYMNAPDPSTDPVCPPTYKNVFMPDSGYMNWGNSNDDYVQQQLPPDLPPRQSPKRPSNKSTARSLSVASEPPKPARPPKLGEQGKSKSVPMEGYPMLIAVFASEPIQSFFWILRVALWHKGEDESKFEQIKSSEQGGHNHLVKPPTPFEAIGNTRIALENIMPGWSLKSESEQIVPYEDLCHDHIQWIVLEFHFAPSQLSQFSAILVIEPDFIPMNSSPKSTLVRNSLGIIQKFVPKPSSLCNNCQSSDNPSYLSLDLNHRRQLMILLDAENMDGKDWTMLAEILIGAEQPEIDFIRSKNRIDFSPTLHVLRTWEKQLKEKCTLDILESVLQSMERLDAVEVITDRRKVLENKACEGTCC